MYHSLQGLLKDLEQQKQDQSSTVKFEVAHDTGSALFELHCGLFKWGHFVPVSREKQSHNSIQHSPDSALDATSNWPVFAVVKCPS